MKRPEGFEKLARRWRQYVELLEANEAFAAKQLDSATGALEEKSRIEIDTRDGVKRYLPEGTRITFRLSGDDYRGELEAMIETFSTGASYGDSHASPNGAWVRIRRGDAFLTVHPESGNVLRVR